jgi:hypothetical protein
MRKSKDAAGASMMEMVLYIGIMTVVGAGVFRLYAEANEKAKRVEIQNQIPGIIKTANLLRMGRIIKTSCDSSDYTCLKAEKDNAYLESKGVKFTHPWSQAAEAITATWKVAQTGAADPIKSPYMEIKVQYLPKASCIWLVSAMSGTGLCTNGGNGNNGATPTISGTYKCDPTPNDAIAQCANTDSTNIVYVRAAKE